MPRPRFRLEGDRAALELWAPEAEVQLHRLEARRVGDRLELEPFEPEDVELGLFAVNTLGMHLALAGWPLVRSETHWARRSGSSQAGDPEGLAYKIGIFEEVAREEGWKVDTPTISGLARWQAWAEGEDFGRKAQLLEDLGVVVEGRGWSMKPEERARLGTWDEIWALPSALSAAVRASDVEAWWAELRRIGLLRD